MANLESDAFVFFGATGDLASKQVFPPLQAMIRHGHLDIPIIGVGTSAENFDQLRAHARESLEKHGGVDARAFSMLSAYIRAGKRLPVTATEVLVQLKRPPQAVFDPVTQDEGDYYRFRLSPNVSISLGARTKKTEEAMVGEPVELVVRQAPGGEMTPYECLLGDAIQGDATLFVRRDSVEAAWSVVDLVLGNAMPVDEYESNTWGPAEADQIVAGHGGWHNPEPAQKTTKGSAK